MNLNLVLVPGTEFNIGMYYLVHHGHYISLCFFRYSNTMEYTTDYSNNSKNDKTTDFSSVINIFTLANGPFTRHTCRSVNIQF